MTDTASSPRTVADLVEATGLTENTVRAAILAGDLPGYRIGTGKHGKYVIPGAAFEAFCNGTWVPIHRTVVEVVTPTQPEGSATARSTSDFLKRRTAS